MKEDHESRLEAVETFKNLLVDHATGGNADEADYRRLRGRLTRDPVLKDKMPRFVRTCRTPNEFWSYIKEGRPTYASRRTHLAEALNPILNALEEARVAPVDQLTDEAIGRLDSGHVHDVWQRALQRRNSDPEGAITLARTLLEGVCKHILDAEGVNYGERDDLKKLYAAVAQTLNLAPVQHVEELFKRILGGCQSVVEGLGALRSKIGDAHSPGKRYVRPAPRHAELAVNLSGTMATFLIATWEAQRTTNPELP